MIESRCFVGRESEKAAFIELLQRDARPCHLLLIVGPTGIGKSYLLETLQILSRDAAANCFSLDLPHKSMEQAVSALLDQLIANTDLNRNENADELALGLRDLPLFSGKPISPARSTTTYTLQYRLSLLAEYLNKISQQRRTVLFVDADVLTRLATGNLCTTLLEHLSEGILIVLATRHQLALTGPIHKESISRLELQPFSSIETFAYLNAYGMGDKDVAASVHAVTKGLPLLIVEAATYILDGKLDLEQFPVRARQVLIDRAFAEVEDEQARDLIRTASIMRRFNLEALTKLSGRRTRVQQLMNQIRECSFVETHGSWYAISAQVRESIADGWRVDSPGRFVALNRKALAYYESFPLSLAGETNDLIGLERMYHHFCIDKKEGMNEAISQFTQAESLLQVGLCRSILGELRQFSFQDADAAEGWIGFCEATIARLEYSWSTAAAKFEKLIANSSSLQIRAYLLDGLSRTLREYGDWKTAEITSRKAGEAFEQLGDRKAKLTALLILGNILARQHRWEESLTRFNAALALITKEQDPLVNLQLQLGLADLFRSQGRWDVALKHLDIALSKAEEMHSKALQAQVWHSLGKLHRSRYAWDTAIYYYERSAVLREEIADQLGQAQSLHSLGNVCLRAGRLEEAEVALQKSLAIKEKIGDKFGIAKSYYGIGHIKRLRGELENALVYYRQSLHLLKEVNNHVKASRVMCRIGMTLAALNRISEAIEFLEASRDTRQKSNDPQGVSETLYELGLVHERNGDIPTAQESFLLSFRFAKNSNSFTRQLAPMIELAVLAYREGDSKSGAEHLLVARQIAAQSKQHILLAHLYAEKAKAEAETNRLTTAFLCYAEAVYAAADEDYRTASTMFHDLVSLLEQVENSSGKQVAEDFAYRLLVFWQKNCETPRKETWFWPKLVLPDVDVASQNKGAALSYLRRLQLELSSAEVNTERHDYR